MLFVLLSMPMTLGSRPCGCSVMIRNSEAYPEGFETMETETHVPFNWSMWRTALFALFISMYSDTVKITYFLVSRPLSFALRKSMQINRKRERHLFSGLESALPSTSRYFENHLKLQKASESIRKHFTTPTCRNSQILSTSHRSTAQNLPAAAALHCESSGRAACVAGRSGERGTAPVPRRGPRWPVPTPQRRRYRKPMELWQKKTS